MLKDKDFHPGKNPQINVFGDRQLKPGTANSIGLSEGMNGTCSHSKTSPITGDCTFHIGVIAKRAWQTEVTGPATTIRISIDNDPEKIFVDTVNMGPYITDKNFIVFTHLSTGTHTVKVEIDPLNMVDERDEKNNSFTVTINVHK